MTTWEFIYERLFKKARPTFGVQDHQKKKFGPYRKRILLAGNPTKCF